MSGAARDSKERDSQKIVYKVPAVLVGLETSPGVLGDKYDRREHGYGRGVETSGSARFVHFISFITGSKGSHRTREAENHRSLMERYLHLEKEGVSLYFLNKSIIIDLGHSGTRRKLPLSFRASQHNYRKKSYDCIISTPFFPFIRRLLSVPLI